MIRIHLHLEEQQRDDMQKIAAKMTLKLGQASRLAINDFIEKHKKFLA